MGEVGRGCNLDANLVQIPALLFSKCVSLHQLLSYDEPQLLYL